MESKKIHVGIGFVTGRKNFKDVVSAYINNWNECGLADKKKYVLHLFVAYDLKYRETDASDYQITEEAVLGAVDFVHYLGNAEIAGESRDIVKKKIITAKEAKLIFGEGYAMKRNAVLYFALKEKMDYLIFLDDDEYPIANIRMGNTMVWQGQEMLSTHIANMEHADMTHGHHCGYISPIPHMNFNEKLTQEDFKVFIQAISNDIVNWDSVKKKMDEGGVTYASPEVIDSKDIIIVKEINGMKFISGANLGLNLKDKDKLFPFYNPPGARGEDTFLSTCIGECKIRKVPCYTFHDGFAVYGSLLHGVLPTELKTMEVTTAINYKRFLKAAVGWVRYKPLLVYITQRKHYETKMVEMRKNLEYVLPKMCDYFGNEDFAMILKEFDLYRGRVQQHFDEFERTKDAWVKVVATL